MVQVLLIAIFMALLMRDASARPWLGGLAPATVTAVVLGSMAALWLASQAYIWLQGRRLDRFGDLRPVRRADLAGAAARLLGTFVHVGAVVGLGWLDVVRSVTGDLIVVDEFVAAAPVLLLFVGTWWSIYPIDRRLREAVLMRDLDDGRPVRPGPSRGAHVIAAIRHQAALVLVPVAAVLAWYEGVERLATRLPGWLPAAALEVLGMVAVLSFMPVVMRRVWDTVALGPGPLRDMLREMCRVHGVRIRELLVWRTHGSMINGAVMGFAGPLRYILLTDALLEHLPAEQVEAVMAHELGHIRRRHMLWLGVAALAVVLLSMGGGRWALARWAGAWSESPWMQGLVVTSGLGIALLLFGLVSRRFEWQADAFAVQHLSGKSAEAGPRVVSAEAAAAMSGALEAVARLNNIPRERFTWRHGSIGARQRRLASLVGQRADQLPIDRDAMAIKVAAAAAMALAVLVVVRTGVS